MAMNDNLLLVESLDKDWEDSGSEQLDIDETDPLEVASKAFDCQDLIKEEFVDETDPLTEKHELSNRDENSTISIEMVTSCRLEISEPATPASIDIDLKEAADSDENSNFTVLESSVLSDSINLSVGETQQFIMHVNADEVTLTPDNGCLITAPSETITPCAEFVDDRDKITDSSSTEKKQPQFSLKRKKLVKPICQGERLRKNTSGSGSKKSDLENVSNVPSVYSYSEIKRHKKRLTLKALQNDSSSDSDSRSSEDSYDPDLDVNLRIFEGSNETTKENVIIGEIHCDMPAEGENTVDVNSQKQNKNTVFKLSVNADFSEKAQTEEASYTRINDMPSIQISDESDERMNKIFINDDEDVDDLTDEDINGLSSVYDDDFFSGNDSDLEILTSKSISRKRIAAPILRKERPTDSEKRTMYDLIYDTVTPAPRSKEKSSGVKSKTEPKKKKPRKSKADPAQKKRKKCSVKDSSAEQTVTSNDEKTTVDSETASDEKITEESDSTSKDTPVNNSKEANDERTNDALPVPQLKVNADGEVIIDTESLMIEQTGVAEARQAIANSEVVEETGLSYRSYSKKNNFRRQWSPHDTLKFYDVLSVVGTDFTLMATLFPGRTRNCIKRKYKKEEKTNRDLITKALTCKQKFNIGLLEKELKLKEERVNVLKNNAKREKQKEKEEKARKKKDETPKVAKTRAPSKRKSFFERGISCFQDS